MIARFRGTPGHILRPRNFVIANKFASEGCLAKCPLALLTPACNPSADRLAILELYSFTP